MANSSQHSQQNPLFIRNLTTLGHVDHGKTTLMDSLLASNNIISARMAGKIRYMDSREDEQERGITMEASAVGLKYRIKDGDMYVLNMIDTPGHVDFQSEVSTASRLCDGALILVDVVEGVQTQTTSLLRQAYQDQLTPILVLNKVDRMITELKLTPEEAYERLARVVEDVNVVMGGLWGGERMKKADHDLDEDTGTGLEDDSGIYFDPAQGNVIFASAIDSWGFRPSHFARLVARKLFAEQIQSGKLTPEALKEKEESLKKVMWGEWYFDPKSKRVVGPKAKRPGMKTLFVQIVLENLWQVYDAVMGNPNPDKVLKIISSLSLTLPPRELRSIPNLTSANMATNSTDASSTNDYPKHLLSLIFAQWLPLTTSIVQTVIDIVPPPGVAQGRRMGRMLGFVDEPSSNSLDSTSTSSTYEHLYSASPSPTVPVCAYVSKMFAIRRGDLPEEKEKARTQAKATHDRKQVAADKSSGREDATVVEDTNENGEVEDKIEEQQQHDQDRDVLLGFARIYSGTLSVDESVLVLLSKFDPALQTSSNDFSTTSVHPSNVPYVLGLPSSSSSSSQSFAAQPFAVSSSRQTHPTRITIAGLYLMMGRELLPVQSVSAGQIFAARFEYDFSVSSEGQGTGSTKEKKKDVEHVVWRGGTVVRPPKFTQEQHRPWLLNLGRITHSVPPIVRLSLLPAQPGDLPALLRGLRILEQADPCVETFQMDGGEWVIGGAGELHLERCLKDLRERFAKVDIHKSKPIVPFRETAVREVGGSMESQQTGQSYSQQQQQQIVQPPQQRQFQNQFGGGSAGGPTGTISASTSPNGIIQFTIRCMPLPSGIREFLAGKRRRGVLNRLRRIQEIHSKSRRAKGLRQSPEIKEERDFWTEFDQICQKEASRKERKHRDADEQRLWKTLAERVCAFGPLGGEMGYRGGVSTGSRETRNEGNGYAGSESSGDGTTTKNVSPDESSNSKISLDSSEFDSSSGGADAYGAGCVLVDARLPQDQNMSPSLETVNSSSTADKFDPLPYILTGFQLAMRQGPLCAEPVEGLAYFVEKVEVDWERLSVEIEQNRITQTTGSLISAVRDACRSALLEWSPRLMLAMYSCDIQCSTDVLGRVYGVLSKRKGRVVAEEMNEGTSFYTITARLPVVESFGFADELRKKTSGAAGAMLVFDGYDLLPLSPFWVPSTIEELEDLGTTADRVNQAKVYMDGVRDRKGMFVDRKLMMEPEKQRTLKK